MTKAKISNFFFQKTKPTTLLVQHVKGQPAASTYVQKKGCPTCDTNRGTPCSSALRVVAVGSAVAAIRVVSVAKVDAAGKAVAALRVNAMGKG